MIVGLIVACLFLWWLGRRDQVETHQTHGGGLTTSGQNKPIATLLRAVAGPNQSAVEVPPTKSGGPKSAADPRAELKTTIESMLQYLAAGDYAGCVQFNFSPELRDHLHDSDETDDEYLQKIAAGKTRNTFPILLEDLLKIQNTEPISIEQTDEGMVANYRIAGSDSTFRNLRFVKIDGLWFLD